MRLDVTICKASEVVGLVSASEKAHTPFAIVISIEHPCDETVSVEQGRAPRLATEIGPQWRERQLILTCHDIETAQPGLPAPSTELVQSALEHFERWRPEEGVMRILLHCRSGKARSTALALVLLRHHRGPDTETECLRELLGIRPLAAPNIAIVQHGDALLGCGGSLVRAVENDSEVTERRAEANFALLARAGLQAMERGALGEAELYFREAIAALASTPETPERIQRELSLQITLLSSLVNTSGSGTEQTAMVVERLRELGEKSTDPNQQMLALIASWGPLVARGEITTSLRIANQILEIAKRGSHPGTLTFPHLFQANSRTLLGDLRGALLHFEAAIASYNEADHAGAPADPHIGALAGMGRLLRYLGFADQGRAKIQTAISLSERSARASNLAQSLSAACFFYFELGEAEAVLEQARRLFDIATEHQLKPSLSVSLVFRGWAMAELGHADEGLLLIREGLELHAGRGTSIVPSVALGEAQARAGQIEQAIITIEQAIAAAGEQHSNLPRATWRRGELLMQRGDDARAASDFRDVIANARRDGSKAYELRATISLVRLLRKQGKRDDARTMLAETYAQFSEGFETADLRDAKAMLVELSR